MAILNETGLQRYTDQVKQYVQSLIPKLDNTKTKEEISSSRDGVYYFTTDTKEIYRNGENYGGNVLDGYATEEFVTSQGYLTQTLVLNYINDSLSDYITSDDLSDFGFLTEVPSLYVTDGELEEMGYATEDWVKGRGYLTQHQDISTLATKEDISDIRTELGLSDNVGTLFANTNNLTDCTTLVEAILKLDSLLNNLS